MYHYFKEAGLPMVETWDEWNRILVDHPQSKSFPKVHGLSAKTYGKLLALHYTFAQYLHIIAAFVYTDDDATITIIYLAYPRGAP